MMESLTAHVPRLTGGPRRDIDLELASVSTAGASAVVKVRAAIEIPLKGNIAATFITFDGLQAGAEHFAIRVGTLKAREIPLVRMHSECITGDLFGSLRCDCGAQLGEAIERFRTCGGLVLYLRQEGRGIGLAAKLDAYRLQDEGLDTYEANRALSFPADARDYSIGAAMLRALGFDAIRLMTNNPDKVAALERRGVEVIERVATGTFRTPFNCRYLVAKAALTGHTLDI